MATFFTADLHFGHENILKYHPNRGESVEEMNERIIENWNATVRHAQDEVWFLGDLAMGKLDGSLLNFHKLRGKKHLLRGNHDGNRTVNLPWSSVSLLHEWKQKPHRAVLCHYPLLTWNGAHHGVWMLHGHSHGLLVPTSTTRLDVGIDTHPEFRPYHLDEIVEIMAERAYEPVDAHVPERKLTNREKFDSPDPICSTCGREKKRYLGSSGYSGCPECGYCI